MSRPGQCIEGFVVDIGRKWVLIAVTTTGGFFDGYAAVRLADVSRVRFDRSFQRRFAATQPEWPVSAPSGRAVLDLDSTAAMLRTFLTADVLCAIERNKKYDALWVGVPYEIDGRWLYLFEVRPDATWHEVPLGYRNRSITVVRLGDQYLRALSAVAGPIPVHALKPWASVS